MDTRYLSGWELRTPQMYVYFPVVSATRRHGVLRVICTVRISERDQQTEVRYAVTLERVGPSGAHATRETYLYRDLEAATRTYQAICAAIDDLGATVWARGRSRWAGWIARLRSLIGRLAPRRAVRTGSEASPQGSPELSE